MPPPLAEDGAAQVDTFLLLPPTNPSVYSMRLRKVANVVKSVCRLQSCYTEYKVQKRLRLIARFRLIARVVRVVNCFLQRPPRVSPDELAGMVCKRSIHTLQGYGGVGGLADILGTSLDTGMHGNSLWIRKRQEEFGANIYVWQSPKAFLSFLVDPCKDAIIVWALQSFASGFKITGKDGGWLEDAAIAIVLILTILLTSLTNYRQCVHFLRLIKSEEKQRVLVTVVRGGRKKKIPVSDIVVGDIAFLKVGDQVPADGVFVEGCPLCVDESAVTGECNPVYVNCRLPFLVSGCLVIKGSGKMLVTGVGMRTEWAWLVAEPKDAVSNETPLQACLSGVDVFFRQVGWIAVVIGYLILFVSNFVVHKEDSENSGKFKAGQWTIFTTIMVLVLPQGLPFAVTLSMENAMTRMMAHKALVRCLAACETMGRATTICTNKTGTLTMNQRIVVQTWVAGNYRDVDGNNLSTGDVKGEKLSTEVRSVIFDAIALISTAAIDIPMEGREPEEMMGSSIEKALLKWGLELGMDVNGVMSGSKVVRFEPFNSTKGRAGVVGRVGANGRLCAHWMGVAETILAECDTVLGNDNHKAMLTDSKKLELMNVIHGMSAHGFCCVAYGFRELEEVKLPEGVEQLEAWNIPEGGLTLTAIVGMKDACVSDAAEAVQKCRAAGVMVCMITGDNLATAKRVAVECGILQSEGIAVEGSTFRGYNAETRRQVAPKIAAMARASPSDKLLFVRTLKKLGKVVAVVGNGCNDVPALKEAHIGVCMGLERSEAAKESSDIIILENNFATVIKMLGLGRSVYFNVQKFIQFQTATNFAALSINFVAAVYVGDGPLTAIRLLWINLIISTLGAFALATEVPTDEELQRPAIQGEEPLISNSMIRNFVVQALYQVVVLLSLKFCGEELLGLEGADATNIIDAMIFNAFVLCQLFNEVNARKLDDLNVLKGLFNNGCFVGVLCSSLAIQVIGGELLSKFSFSVKLSWQNWLVCIGIAIFTWPIALLGKLIPMPETSLCNVELGKLCGTNSQVNEAWHGLQTMVVS